MLHSINQEQRLYVLPSGTGYSCLGFDVAERWMQDVLEWLPAEARPAGVISDAIALGTAAHYAAYEATMSAGAAHAAATKTRCPAQLSKPLVGLEGKRVEVTLPSGDRSRFYVGKSTGWLPIHLEIKTRRSHGGCGAYVPEGASVRVVGAR